MPKASDSRVPRFRTLIKSLILKLVLVWLVSNSVDLGTYTGR